MVCLTKISVPKDISIILKREKASAELNFQGIHKPFPTKDPSDRGRNKTNILKLY